MPIPKTPYLKWTLEEKIGDQQTIYIISSGNHECFCAHPYSIFKNLALSGKVRESAKLLDSSSGDHECLYKISCQPNQQLLSYLNV